MPLPRAARAPDALSLYSCGAAHGCRSHQVASAVLQVLLASVTLAAGPAVAKTRQKGMRDVREGTMKFAANLFAALLALLAVQTAIAQSSYPNRPQ